MRKVEIEESILEEARDIFINEGDVNNNFVSILARGQEIKDQDLTPLYLFDMEEARVYVEIKETFGKKLN